MTHDRPETGVSDKLVDIIGESHERESLFWLQEVPGMEAKPDSQKERDLGHDNHKDKRGNMHPDNLAALDNSGGCRATGRGTFQSLNALRKCSVCPTHNKQNLSSEN